ncbi:MAG: tetratricopeptide repeat protein [Isosphaeraceae bacterium]
MGRAGLAAALAAVGLGATALVGGCWPSSEPAVASRARAAAAASDDRLARELLERWLEQDPRDPEPFSLMAETALRLGELEKVGPAIERARALGLDAAELGRLRGLLLARLGRSDEARPLLEAAWQSVGRRRVDPEVSEALSKIRMKEFELGPAIEVLERWARESPADPRPLLWRAEIDRRLNRPAAEIAGRYREALRRDESCLAALVGLADSERAAGNLREAAEQYRLVVAREPRELAGLIGLGLLAVAQGEEQEAISWFDRALEVEPANTLALKERAAVALRRGQLAEARSLADRAVAADPFDPELRYQRSQVMSRQGRADEAAAELARSERLRDEHRRFAQIQQALVRSPGDVALRLEAARWMMDHGRSGEGVIWAEMVLRQQPTNPEANRILADHFAARGDVGLANHYRMHIGGGPDAASPGESPGAAGRDR